MQSAILTVVDKENTPSINSIALEFLAVENLEKAHSLTSILRLGLV